MDHWQHLLPHLRQMMGDDEFTTWIAPLTVHQNTENTVTLTTDNLIVVDWVRDHLLRDIETVARSHFGPEFRVVIAEEESPAPGNTSTPAAGLGSNPFNPTFSFERFVFAKGFCSWTVTFCE